ncbi:hypothetical protein E3E11_00710 [Oecophyllibacter saccharovorans]|uniref:hypothetical protein n=1 Tax=Oecophyllibacter saccharovorans TaxID=2558360 RepID=UPI0011429D35|nr:hypothetical protein [Oecophyllibacter saccharovorans]QDH14624.1 hypothetical protein E3E11_00710 [Oecophyllibacter saccharovorans]
MFNTLLWTAVLTVHLVCVAYWYGGAVYCLQIPRLTRALDTAAAFSVRTQACGRYLRGLWHVIPLAILSGCALIWRMLPQIPWPYHVMGLLGVLMAGVFGLMVFGPYRRILRAVRPQPEMFAKLQKLLWLTVLLGSLAMAAGAAGTIGL